MGKPCSSRLRTLLMAVMVVWDSDESRRVSSSLGTSWNSRSSLAFLAASLWEQERDDHELHYTFTHTHTHTHTHTYTHTHTGKNTQEHSNKQSNTYTQIVNTHTLSLSLSQPMGTNPDVPALTLTWTRSGAR